MTFVSPPATLLERKLVESSRKVSSRPKPLSILRSLEEKYVAAMKKLQFGKLKCFPWDVCMLGLLRFVNRTNCQ